MGDRLYSDIADASGNRYYYDLDTTPGIVQPGAATLTLTGYQVFYPQEVFRNPATAVLTLLGNTTGPEVRLTPAPAALAFSNSVVGLQTIRVITLELFSPVESPDNEFVPDLLTQMVVSPAAGLIALATTNHSLSQGGNIGFLNPTTAALTLIGYAFTRVDLPDQATLSIAGQVPDLHITLVVLPGVGAMSMTPPATRVDKGFLWLDDAAAPTLPWQDD